jgi:hypothetical protein
MNCMCDVPSSSISNTQAEVVLEDDDGRFITSPVHTKVHNSNFVLLFKHNAIKDVHRS